MMEKIWYLKQSTLFEQLPPPELRRLEARSRVRKFPRGTPIYLPAEQPDSVLLLIQGRVKICSVTGQGKQGILALIEPGELFGELALLDTAPREEYAEALEASIIMSIPIEDVQSLLRDYCSLSLGITKLIGLRRKRIERRLKYLLFHSNRQRLVHLLLELSQEHGRRTEAGLELGIKLSHQDLAGIIGSTRETVTMTLGELQREGCLQVKRRRIIITDWNQLASGLDEPLLAPISAAASSRMELRFS